VFTQPFVLALAILVLLASAKVWQNVESANFAEQVAVQEQKFAAFQQQVTRSRTRADMEAAFNGGRPITTTKRPQWWSSPNTKPEMIDECEITDPVTGRALQVQFENEQVKASRPKPGGVAASGRPAGWLVGEHVRHQVALVVGPVLWCVGVFLASLFWHRLRQIPWVCGLLIISLAWSAAGLLGPDTFMNRSHFWMRMEYWIWAILATAITLLWLRHLLRKPLDITKCLHCDYDLTGNVSGICPECGTPVPVPPTPEEIEHRLKVLDERITGRVWLMDEREK
jgi:hypothetical protein